MRFSIKIKIVFDSRKEAIIFFKSIKPELEEKFDRSDLKIFQNDAILRVEIVASDKAAARASLNSIMKPLKLFKSLEELV